VYGRVVKFYKSEAVSYVRQLFGSFYDERDSLFKDVVVADSDLFIESFVDKIGYINLFPFFTGMQQESLYSTSEEMGNLEEKRVKSLRKVIEVMSDEKLLLSKDGLRSLSFSDPLYGSG
jgi:hypothetical protein